VEEPKPSLLIVEDDVDIADMLNAYFRSQGYEVQTVNWGEDGLRACQTNRPDLVILDIRLPDIDGFSVARQLRENRRTSDIPIIFLTEKRERADRLRGLELTAEDYVTKPFDMQELRLRVRNAMSRARMSNLHHPVTGLPVEPLVDERLRVYMQEPVDHLLILSLKNFDHFREIYGFVAADDLLKAVSLIIRDILKQHGSTEDFVGHLTPTDFLVLSRAHHPGELKDRLHKALLESSDYFYRAQDRETADFRDKGLSLTVVEIPAGQRLPKDLRQLKLELEMLYK